MKDPYIKKQVNINRFLKFLRLVYTSLLFLNLQCMIKVLYNSSHICKL